MSVFPSPREYELASIVSLSCTEKETGVGHGAPQGQNMRIPEGKVTFVRERAN